MVPSSDDPGNKPTRNRKRQDRPAEKSVGDALRRVYNDAVQEQIPPDLLDLLNKLD